MGILSAVRYRHKTGTGSAYGTWYGMMRRCYSTNPNESASKWYRDKGITVCERWHNYDLFCDDMLPRPNGFTIHRVNSNGNYCPENCIWISRAENTSIAQREKWCKDPNKLPFVSPKWVESMRDDKSKIFLDIIERAIASGEHSWLTE